MRGNLNETAPLGKFQPIPKRAEGRAGALSSVGKRGAMLYACKRMGDSKKATKRLRSEEW
ncbi:uncharacterized protein METZ01_LOCUS324875, partial [marine metagenome]